MSIPQKMPPYVEDGFGMFIDVALVMFLFLVYVPALYRTVYRIVQEKENRAKESMRMMGLKDLPYWASWFCYYTIVNIMISTLSWLILYTMVFSNVSGFICWGMIFFFG